MRRKEGKKEEEKRRGKKTKERPGEIGSAREGGTSSFILDSDPRDGGCFCYEYYCERYAQLRDESN